MIRRLALVILLLFVGQAGIADPLSIYSQKIELTSEIECNGEAEIQLPTSRKKRENSIRQQSFFGIFSFPIQKLPTYRISQVCGITTSRHIIFRSILI